MNNYSSLAKNICSANEQQPPAANAITVNAVKFREKLRTSLVFSLELIKIRGTGTVRSLRHVTLFDSLLNAKNQ